MGRVVCALHRGVRSAAHPSSSHRAQLVNCTQRGETSRFEGRRWEEAWSKSGGYFCFPSYPAVASAKKFSLSAYLKSGFWFGLGFFTKIVFEQQNQSLQWIQLELGVLLSLFKHTLSPPFKHVPFGIFSPRHHLRTGHPAIMSWKGRCSTKKIGTNTNKASCKYLHPPYLCVTSLPLTYPQTLSLPLCHLDFMWSTENLNTFTKAYSPLLFPP